uniref:Uncharacterized protein n=1 Tax=Ixodes ricinus TaxID=34613 RepID=A0A0K8RDQ6_IXORI
MCKYHRSDTVTTGTWLKYRFMRTKDQLVTACPQSTKSMTDATGVVAVAGCMKVSCVSLPMSLLTDVRFTSTARAQKVSVATACTRCSQKGLT